MAIGHATSADGITWSTETEPVLKATGNVRDWNGYNAAEPGAVVYNGRLYLYFSAIGARPGDNPPQLQTIGLATSDDGTNFDTPRMVFGQAPIYPPELGFVGYSTPSALVHDGVMHLFFDIAHFSESRERQWLQVGLHHAYSRDGETDFVQDELPIFVRHDFDWSAGEILAPTAIVDGNEVLLWFAGHVAVADLGPLVRRGLKGPEFGIGRATINLSELPGH